MKFFRRSFFIFGALFLVLTIGVVYLLFFDEENTKSVYYPISEQEKGLLLDGDIILRQGYGFFSRSIATFQNCKFPVTHCAMIVRKGQDIKVIHSLSSSVSKIDGVQMQSLQQFLNESVPNTIVVSRFKGSEAQRKSLRERAEYYLNQKIPFDHLFDRTDKEKMYCTELFQNIFYDILKEDIFEKQLAYNTTDIYDLTTFFDTSYFDIVINHFQLQGFSK